MRKLIFRMMVSLDGLVAGPKQELDWHMVDKETHRYINEHAREMGAFLYGRRVYELMVDFWPTVDSNAAPTEGMIEFAQIWKTMPKIVFSRTIDTVEWNTRVIKESIAEEVTKLKRQPGRDLVLYGGADIAATFMELDLIDEYDLFVHPIVLGRGKPLFGSLDDTLNLRLIETRTFDTGVILLRYQRTDGRA